MSLEPPNPEKIADSTPFDTASWESVCSAAAKEAAHGTGCAETLYIKKISSILEKELENLPEPHRAQAIEVAKRHDYATPEEICEMATENRNAGLCRHGLDPNCCPCGCGDL